MTMTCRPGLLGICVLAGLATAQAGQQPVYVLLYTHIDDHVHLDISGDRLQRTLALLEKYRVAAPDAHVSAVVQFSGAMAQAIEEGKLKSVPVIVVRAAAQRRTIEIGYRAADEPTHKSRGTLGFRGTKSAEEWWGGRSDAASRLLMGAKEPLTGVGLSGSGGLQKTVEVFGTVSCVGEWGREVGADTEFVHQVRRLKLSPLGFGLPEPAPIRLLHGYRDAARTFGALMSPEPDSAPELFWQDGILRLSETSDRNVRVVHGYEGLEAFKKVVGELDRSKTHVLRVELSAQELYLQPEYAKGFLFPPVRFAYDHPDRPQLPPEALRTQKDIDEAYAREDALVGWLAGDFSRVNPGSRTVSASDLIEMASTGEALNLSRAELTAGAEDLLERWKADIVPPNYARAGNHYFSLADMFQLLATALSQMHRRDRLATTVAVRTVYGPDEMPAESGPNEGQVSIAAVARASALLSDRLNDQRWAVKPQNVVPAWVAVDGQRLNAAQFLRLMAQALIAPSPAGKLQVKMCNMFAPSGEMFPISGSRSDQGATWTLKPAVFQPVARDGGVSKQVNP